MPLTLNLPKKNINRALFAMGAIFGVFIINILLQEIFTMKLLFSSNTVYFMADIIFGISVFLCFQKEVLYKIFAAVGAALYVLMCHGALIGTTLYNGAMTGGIFTKFFQTLRDPFYGNTFGNSILVALIIAAAVILLGLFVKNIKSPKTFALISGGIYFGVNFVEYLIRVAPNLGYSIKFINVLTAFIDFAAEALVFTAAILAVKFLCETELKPVKFYGIGLVWVWIEAVLLPFTFLGNIVTAAVNPYGTGTYSAALLMALAGGVGYILLLCKKHIGLYIIIASCVIFNGGQFIDYANNFLAITAQGFFASDKLSGAITVLVGCLNGLFAYLAVKAGDKRFGIAVKPAPAKAAFAKLDIEKLTPFGGKEGVCDVCNKELGYGEGYLVPNATFYASPEWREKFSALQTEATGAPVTDAQIAEMQKNDKTANSTVCKDCVHMFAEKKAPAPAPAVKFTTPTFSGFYKLNKADLPKYQGSGVCDVCNKPVGPGEAYIVPNNTFYASPEWRTKFRATQQAITGMYMTDAMIENMKAMDHSAGSAVCEDCIHMFAHDPAPANVKKYYERDNVGTRQDSIGKANAYWLVERFKQPVKPPFVLYTFPNKYSAEEALLEMPFIHLASDTGNLICERLMHFGFYETTENNIPTGKYEAIIAGADFTLDEFKLAKAAFEKHGGVRRNDQEPDGNVKAATAAEGDASKVKYVETVKGNDGTSTYEVYSGPDKASAMAFLKTKPVTRGFYYVVVDTPEGSFGRDINGFYQE